MPYLFQSYILEQIADKLEEDEDYVMGLINEDFDLDWGHSIASLEAKEADYNGYARALLQNGVVEQVAAEKKWKLRYEELSFAPTDAAEPNNIYGYFVVKESNNSLVYLVYKYPVPQLLELPAHILRITPEWFVGTLPNE